LRTLRRFFSLLTSEVITTDNRVLTVETVALGS
jgi:hypothetical protein